MAEDLELLDTHTDSSHRSYRRAVKHERLGPLRLRSSTERVPLHELWIDRFVIYPYQISTIMIHLIIVPFMQSYRLREARLLTVARLVDTWHSDETPRCSLDPSLLTALVDRWRPETHTFHFPTGEMAPTLQDVSHILGLPISGAPVAARAVPPNWHFDLNNRFVNVMFCPGFVFEPHRTEDRIKGPRRMFFVQFKVSLIIFSISTLIY